jgi:CTD kinase subunit gamma
VEEIIASLEERKNAQITSASAPVPPLSRPEIVKRIEEDRERHKRLRERRWVQPVSHHPHAAMLPPPLASFLPLDEADEGWRRDDELTLDIEFENEWETTSDWNEDDDDAVAEETELCFPDRQDRSQAQEKEKAMDLG